MLGATTDGWPLDFFHRVKGPEFLIGYGIWFALLFGISRCWRKDGGPHPVASGACWLLFVVVGVIRIYVGSTHGMHKWELLILMMILGSMLFFARFDNTGGSSGSSSTWGSCSGSSCSSGGGCGGGGGGCGGCGGGGD